MKFGFGKSRVPVAEEKDFLMLIHTMGLAKMFGEEPSSMMSSIQRLLTNEANGEVFHRAMVSGFFRTVSLISQKNSTQAGPLATGLYLCATRILEDGRWVCATQVLWTYFLAGENKPSDALESAANTAPLLSAMDAPDDWKLIFARAVATACDKLPDKARAIQNWEAACEIKERGGAQVFSLVDLYLGLGSSYANAERWEEARLTFLKIWMLANANDPLSQEAANAAYEIAFASLQVGDHASGIDFLGRSISIREQTNPRDPELPEMRQTLTALRAKHEVTFEPRSGI